MLRTLILCLLSGLVMVPLGCGPAGDSSKAPWSAQAPRWGARHDIDDLRIVECSGLVTSRQYPGIGWIHNDSGDEAQIFSVDAQGQVLSRVRIEGARNVDWEDLARDENDRLYICDLGNNHSRRQDLRVYVIDEPAPTGQESAVVLRILRLHYPEQQQFPDADRRFDCEANFIANGTLYVITKHATAGPSRLYRVVDMQSEDDQALELVDYFDTGSQVTGADLSPDGSELAVLSYEYIHLYQLEAGQTPRLSSTRSVRIPLEARQCECIAYEADVLRVINEQREIHLFARDAVHEGGQWSNPEASAEYEVRDNAPPELRPGYLPPRDAFELPGSGMVQLPLQKGYGEKRVALPAAPDTASVMIERDGNLLRLGLRWTPMEGGNDDGILAWISWGPTSERMICGVDDSALRLVFDAQGSPALLPENLTPQAMIPAHSLQRRGAFVEGWIELPDAAGAPGEVSLSVVLISPSGADWHFGGDSSMFTWRNPVLWGVLR